VLTTVLQYVVLSYISKSVKNKRDKNFEVHFRLQVIQIAMFYGKWSRMLGGNNGTVLGFNFSC
jgi:hypothetical protein